MVRYEKDLLLELIFKFLNCLYGQFQVWQQRDHFVLQAYASLLFFGSFFLITRIILSLLLLIFGLDFLGELLLPGLKYPPQNSTSLNFLNLGLFPILVDEFLKLFKNFFHFVDFHLFVFFLEFFLFLFQLPLLKQFQIFIRPLPVPKSISLGFFILFFVDQHFYLIAMGYEVHSI